MVPALGAVIGFITFIASTISRVSPAFTESPRLTKRLAPGSGDRNAVPTIGERTATPSTGSVWLAALPGKAWLSEAACAGAAIKTGAAAGAAYVGAGSRRTLILR